MEPLPLFVSLENADGKDTTFKIKKYVEIIYSLFLKSLAKSDLSFNGKQIRYQYSPEIKGKHYIFWHLIQEGGIEDKRIIDLERCKRIKWISWVIKNAFNDNRIRVLKKIRDDDLAWVLWLYEENYVVVLIEKPEYCLLKTAYMLKPHKIRQFEAEWGNSFKNDFVEGKG